ncbi:putative oxidoreductase At4g09670 [Apium graveolens]|uniref:putative oxidoreductase At4g09670 n=1 Tax=Apium graveolens TaxID=4045 RepID=UPI003D7B5BEA
MADPSAPIRFGIIGCADIARKLSRAINLTPNASLAAVGSRSSEKAAQFAAANNFPATSKVYGSYDAVLDDPEIDAVYLPLPTSLHVVWAVKAAEKKKHVLLEKPVAINAFEFDTIIEACERNGVQFMDGTMWMHHPRTSKIQEFLSDSENFGELKAVSSCFGFSVTPDFLENDIRTKPDLDGLGALGDVGWYCIRSILLATDFELPKFVTALPGTVFNKAGVILTCGASLHWEDGKVATFHCSFLQNLTMDVTFVGTNGTLHMHDFVIPYEENKASFSTGIKSGFNDLVTGWVPKPSEHTVMTDLPQECLMVREFSRLVADIENGAKPEIKWPAFSRKTQLTLDAVKESVYNDSKKVEIVN